MKRLISILLALIIIFVPFSVLADEDKEAPIIEVWNMQILISGDKEYASAGDTVTVAVPVREKVALDSVTITIDSPSGAQSFTRNMKKYGETDLYYTAFLIDENSEIGHWNISKMKATDTSGNYMYITNLTEYKFGVTGKINDSDVTLPNGSKYTFSPAGVKPKVAVSHNGAALKEGVDYSVKYQNNTAAGTATVTVSGIGCLEGTIKKTFTVTPKKEFKAALKYSTFYYNGKAKTPNVVVTDGKYTVPKSNCTVTYAKGRINVGKYAVKVAMKNNYTGGKTLYFVVRPQSTAITKLTPAKKSVKVSWKKQSVQTTGYQIQYSTSKNFTAGTTKHIISANHKKFVRTIKGLKSGKKYYFRVRTYKKTGGRTFYSKWSKVKTVKTK
ncbi:MAG: fibronectin type III domain-containing protein [Eubacterium sp.]|nr:fibronectin type III domain-containing protein [Eubacterium sp.]